MTRHTTVRGTKELFEAFERICAEHYREFNVPTEMSPSQRYTIVPYGPYWMISDCLADGEYMDHPVYEIETLEDAEMLRGRLIRGDQLHEKARLPADVQHLRAMGYLKGKRV